MTSHVVRPGCPSLPAVLWCCFVATMCAAAEPGACTRDDCIAKAGMRAARVQDVCLTAEDVNRALAALAPSDVAIPVAASVGCSATHLPASRAQLTALLPEEHRGLIDDGAVGRTTLQREVVGFDLVAAIEDPADHPAEAAAIRGFFDERAVDVATGVGCSDGPYPVSFDWVVVLDPRLGTISSYILNCQD